MNPNDYQKKCLEFAVYPNDKSIEYLSLGLASESGEVCDKVKKFIRGDKELDKEALAKELGDNCYYIAMLAETMGYTFSEILQMNIDKLESRKKRNVLQGSGDDR